MLLPIKDRQMQHTPPTITTEEDDELEVADWIDSEGGKKAYSVGNSRSIMLK